MCGKARMSALQLWKAFLCTHTMGMLAQSLQGDSANCDMWILISRHYSVVLHTYVYV